MQKKLFLLITFEQFVKKIMILLSMDSLGHAEHVDADSWHLIYIQIKHWDKNDCNAQTLETNCAAS